MKKRIEATHFIEVWRGQFGEYLSEIKPIDELRFFIKATRISGFKTIAVWKIKAKEVAYV